MKNKVDLLAGSISESLVKLLIPQLCGFFAVTAFNFADSWFVSQLDKSLPEDAESLFLSSISMTFPVVFAIGSIAIGMGIAVTTLISRAYGAGNHDLARRITRDSVILVVLFAAVVTIIGLFTVDPLFRFMGARVEQLPLLRDYMYIWYGGCIFMLIPMTCNNAMRGYGNTFWPGMIMIIGSVVNIILDPVLIFGLGFIPAMGVKGAAIATVIARVLTAVVSLWLVLKWHLIAKTMPRLEEMLHEWKELLFYALPGIVGKISLPIGIFGITTIAASLGKNAVAALSAGSRVEQLIMVMALGLSMVLMIFVSQNLAAGKKDRARKALNTGYKWIITYSVFGLVVLVVCARYIAVWFNNINGVQDMTVLYMTIIPICYPLTSLYMIAQQSFFAIRKPLLSGLMDLIKFFIVMVPSAWLGAHYYGFAGMIVALAVSGTASSILAVSVFEYCFRRVERQ